MRVLGAGKWGGRTNRPPETDCYPVAHLRRLEVSELQPVGQADPAETATG